MTQEKQQDPIEEAGGYGTPTAEQELPGGDAKLSTPQGSARTVQENPEQDASEERRNK